MRTLIFSFLVLLLSCREIEKYPEANYVTFQDERINEFIKSYISFRKLDKTKYALFMEIEKMGSRKVLALGDIKAFAEFKYRNYTIIEGYLVIISTSIDYLNSSETTDYSEPFAYLMDSLNLKLSDQSALYDPPIWALEICGDESKITKGLSFITNYLPCDYYLERDKDLLLDTLHLRRQVK